MVCPAGGFARSPYELWNDDNLSRITIIDTNLKMKEKARKIWKTFFNDDLKVFNASFKLIHHTFAMNEAKIIALIKSIKKEILNYSFLYCNFFT